MIKIFCDRCKKEVTNRQSSTLRLEGVVNLDDDYDLCSECARELKNWLEDYREETYYK